MLNDYEILDAVKKGTLILKLKYLRALGYLSGPMGRLNYLKVTPDGDKALKERRGTTL